MSSNSWLLKSWHTCWTHLIWNENSIIFISNHSNLASYHGRHYVNLSNLLHWYDPYDCLWGPHWKLPWQVWLPHQNITIIMIIIIITIIINYIIIMIILWLNYIIFLPMKSNQFCKTIHRRRVELRSHHHLGCLAGYSCLGILGEAEVSFL